MNLGFLVALVASIAWGGVYALNENLVKNLSPPVLMSAIYLIGGLCFLPVAYYNRTDIVQTVSSYPWQFVSILALIILAENCIVWSISLLGGAEAGLVEISYPIWTALLLYLFQGKSLTKGTVVGGSFVILGIIIMFVMNRSENEIQIR